MIGLSVNGNQAVLSCCNCPLNMALYSSGTRSCCDSLYGMEDAKVCEHAKESIFGWGTGQSRGGVAQWVGSSTQQRLKGLAHPHIQALPMVAEDLALYYFHELGSNNVYEMKGNRRWLFLAAAFAHAHVGSEPAVMGTLLHELSELGRGGRDRGRPAGRGARGSENKNSNPRREQTVTDGPKRSSGPLHAAVASDALSAISPLSACGRFRVGCCPCRNRAWKTKIKATMRGEGIVNWAVGALSTAARVGAINYHWSSTVGGSSSGGCSVDQCQALQWH